MKLTPDELERMKRAMNRPWRINLDPECTIEFDSTGERLLSGQHRIEAVCQRRDGPTLRAEVVVIPPRLSDDPDDSD